MQRPSLILGRFQPLTANHTAFIRQILAEGRPVCVGVFDTVTDDRNPYTVDERLTMIRQAFGDAVTVTVLPHIAEVCYGRDVGYGLRQVELADELPQISGTLVRHAQRQSLGDDLHVDANRWIAAYGEIARQQHADMTEWGFWPDGTRNDGEAIAGIHSELTEVFECLRDGNPPDKNLPEFSGAEVQMADVLGRLMDLSAGRGWRIAEALLAKMKFNRTRPYRHGKEF